MPHSSTSPVCSRALTPVMLTACLIGQVMAEVRNRCLQAIRRQIDSILHTHAFHFPTMTKLLYSAHAPPCRLDRQNEDVAWFGASS